MNRHRSRFSICARDALLEKITFLSFVSRRVICQWHVPRWRYMWYYVQIKEVLRPYLNPTWANIIFSEQTVSTKCILRYSSFEAPRHSMSGAHNFVFLSMRLDVYPLCCFPKSTSVRTFGRSGRRTWRFEGCFGLTNYRLSVDVLNSEHWLFPLAILWRVDYIGFETLAIPVFPAQGPDSGDITQISDPRDFSISSMRPSRLTAKGAGQAATPPRLCRRFPPLFLRRRRCLHRTTSSPYLYTWRTRLDWGTIPGITSPRP